VGRSSEGVGHVEPGEPEQPNGRRQLGRDGFRRSDIQRSAGDLGSELLIAGGHPRSADDALSIFASTASVT